MPIKQAPAAPPELIQAMVCMAVTLNKPHLGALVLLCFVGLLRVREALSLQANDVVMQKRCFILCLGVTKRGMEQKVVINTITVVECMTNFLTRFPPEKGHDRLLNISYSSALRWIRKLGDMLDAGHLGLTTRSFRRSGASELARQGVSLPDILMFGRWLSQRSARDYIRRGEVASVRARQLLHGPSRARIHNWSHVGLRCWTWFDQFYGQEGFHIDVRKLTTEKLSKVERMLFST